MFFLALYFLDGKASLEVLNKTFDLDKNTRHRLKGIPNIDLVLNVICDTFRFLARHHVAAVASMYLISIVWFVATIGNSNYVGRYKVNKNLLYYTN